MATANAAHAQAGAAVDTLRRLPPVTAVAFAPGGDVVVVASQAGLSLRSWPGLEEVGRLPTQLTNVHDLAFSTDGRFLAAAGGEPAELGTVELYEWPGATLQHRFTPHDDLVYSLAWNAEGSILATASADQSVGLHEVARAQLDTPALSISSRRLEGHSRPVLAVAFLSGAANEALVVSASVDATIRLWDVPTGESVRSLTNHTQAVHALAVQPGASAGALPLLASAGDDRTVRLWQSTIGRLVRFIRLESEPLDLAWSADGKLLYAACRDGHLRAIDPQTVAQRQDWPAIGGVAYALAVAPDGSILVGGRGGQLRRVELSAD